MHFSCGIEDTRRCVVGRPARSVRVSTSERRIASGDGVLALSDFFAMVDVGLETRTRMGRRRVEVRCILAWVDLVDVDINVSVSVAVGKGLRR